LSDGIILSSSLHLVFTLINISKVYGNLGIDAKWGKRTSKEAAPDAMG
jgi:hypothetical protein